MRTRFLYLLSALCGAMHVARAEAPAPRTVAAIDSLRGEDLLRHIRVLADDKMEGRAPGGAAEERVVEYLTGELRRLGLRPGNPDGSYIQEVPLVAFTSKPALRVTVPAPKGGKEAQGAERQFAAAFPSEFVALSRRMQPSVDVRASELVFVGHGVVAPEHGWDDYKGLDVRGKTLVMLVGDPPVADAQDPARLDERVFGGKAMTYYGRWTYKYEIASEKGAAAAIIIHEPKSAGYPYEIVSNSWGRENFDLVRKDPGARVAVEGWLREDKARELLSLAGRDLDALRKAAARRDFRPVPLGLNIDIHVDVQFNKVRSRNVAGLLPGSDPQGKNEYVVFTAHWDHLGRDPQRSGDQIYNGAVDNASGVASLLELAEAFTKLPRAPRRSLLFLSVTAEERGLLGARHYVENPLYPLARTAANVNIDGINVWGRTRDIVDVGLGKSELDDLLVAAAKQQGRTVIGDAEPEKGFYFRSDHFEFARAGVPTLDLDSGIDYVGRPADYGKKKREEYTTTRYHKPSDEVLPEWDLSGAVEDLALLFQIAHRVADGRALPAWKPGSGFRRPDAQAAPAPNPSEGPAPPAKPARPGPTPRP